MGLLLLICGLLGGLLAGCFWVMELSDRWFEQEIEKYEHLLEESEHTKLSLLDYIERNIGKDDEE